MPNSRIFGASAGHRWPPGVSESTRRRQARATERRSQSGLISYGPPNALQPAAHAGLVVPIGVAEPSLQVRLLARDDAVANRDCQRQGEDQGPRALCGYADAAVEKK